MVLAVAESASRVGLWPLGTVPYSQSTAKSPTGHRDDCSGYVSMILGLATPGLSTVGLRDLVDPIPVAEVRRGDLLGNLGPGTEGNAGHVQWVDAVSATSVTVYEQTGGSAGPHRNTYKRPGFPAWRVRGAADAVVDPIQSGAPDMILIVQKGTGATYTYNGVWRSYQGNPDVVKSLVGIGVPMLAVDDVGQYGIEFAAAEYYADRDRSRAADTKVVAAGGDDSGDGGLTYEQTVAAAREGAELAEDS
jgi:hypothetical protein